MEKKNEERKIKGEKQKCENEIMLKNDKSETLRKEETNWGTKEDRKREKERRKLLKKMTETKTEIQGETKEKWAKDFKRRTEGKEERKRKMKNHQYIGHFNVNVLLY